MCGMKVGPIPFGRERLIAFLSNCVITASNVDQGCSASTPTVRKNCRTGEVGLHGHWNVHAWE